MSATEDHLKPVGELITHLLQESSYAPDFDQPHEFLVIRGDEESPTMEHLCTVPLHIFPWDFLNFMQFVSEQTQEPKLPHDTLGLVVVNENWRHMHWDEFCKELPHVAKLMIEKGAELGMDEANVKVAYYKSLAGIPPSTAPEGYRRSIRVVSAVMADGWTVTAFMDEDGTFEGPRYTPPEPNTDAETDEEVVHHLGRIPDCMRRFLKGLVPWPKGERFRVGENGAIETIEEDEPDEKTALPSLASLLRRKS